jgi:serine/threonine protein kinase
LHELSPPVLHRDIKPSNLILGEDKQIYLVDFGAVQAQAAVTGVTFTVVGTSGYAPLEQFWGRAVASSDLYALGATLIHLLTGTTPADLPQKDSRIQFSDKVSLNPSFVCWIENMTEIAIEKRYSTAQQALEALQSGQVQSSTATKHPALKKIPKPSGTYIQLNKSAEKLKIRIPAPGLRKLEKYGFLLKIFYISLGFYILLIPMIILVLNPMGLFQLIIGTSIKVTIFMVILITILVMWLSMLFGEKNNISFDRDYLELERQTLIFSYGKEEVAIRDIVGVFLQKEGDVYQVNIRSYYKNSYYKNSPYKSYRLGGALGEHESAWLAQEIQDWLNLR